MRISATCWIWAALGWPLVSGAAEPPHNVILFVPDGLRAQIVTPATAPAMAQLRAQGVDFRNSHALFPTVTTSNASAFATGHDLADTGDFSNVIYTGFAVRAAGDSVTPFLESDAVLREVNQHFNGNYLSEASIVAAAARERQYSVALIGKLGPVAVFDVGALKDDGTLVIDDATGSDGKPIALSAEWQDAFSKFKVAQRAPPRGDNGNFGNAATPGTWIPDLAQQQYFLEVAVKAVLPHFSETGKPFILVFWSRDPDGTQHFHGDSFHSLTPGINGPTSLSAIRNADTALASIEEALRALDLEHVTDIIVVADHGFSSISKTSATSPSTKPRVAYRAEDVTPGELPPGFLAIDLFAALGAADPTLRLFDPDRGNQELDWRAGNHPLRGNAVLGRDPTRPEVVIAANGGSDLVYVDERLSRRSARRVARVIVGALLQQDYVSGIFVDEHRFGQIAGALGTESINVGGANAATPHPGIVVSFASRKIDGCRLSATLCAAEIADTGLQQGQGMHGSLSRADTWNFMAARGPDFKQGYVDELPVSNADVGATLAELLGLTTLPRKGAHTGRVLREALRAHAGPEPPLKARVHTLESKAAGNGLKTVLSTQELESEVYLDAGGFPGRTVGLDAEK
jgi:hypothetical protein